MHVAQRHGPTDLHATTGGRLDPQTRLEKAPRRLRKAQRAEGRGDGADHERTAGVWARVITSAACNQSRMPSSIGPEAATPRMRAGHRRFARRRSDEAPAFRQYLDRIEPVFHTTGFVPRATGCDLRAWPPDRRAHCVALRRP